MAAVEPAARRRPMPGRSARSATHAAPLLTRLVTSPQFVVVVVILAFVAFGATQSAQFLNAAAPGSTSSATRSSSPSSPPSPRFVFVSGGLDLSVGSLFAVGAMASAGFLAAGLPIPLGDPARDRAPAASPDCSTAS